MVLNLFMYIHVLTDLHCSCWGCTVCPVSYVSGETPDKVPGKEEERIEMGYVRREVEGSGGKEEQGIRGGRGGGREGRRESERGMPCSSVFSPSPPASHTHHGAKAIDVIAAVLLTQQLHHLLQVVGNVSSLHTGYRLWKGIEGICTTSSQLIVYTYMPGT